MNRIEFTAGAGVRQPQGRRLHIEANRNGSDTPVSVLARAIRNLPSSNESWFSSGIFDGDYRAAQNWRGQYMAWLDVDHQPGGNHSPMTDEAKELLRFCVENDMLPGNLFYATPRGCRIGFVFTVPVTDGDRAKAVLTGAAALVDQALRDAGAAPLGLSVDRQTLDLPRLLFAPRALVGDVKRDAPVVELRSELYDPESLIDENPDGELSVVRYGTVPDSVPSMLERLDPDDYSSWVETGMGLRTSYGDAAYPFWDRWSSRSAKYPGAKETKRKWDTFQRKAGKLVTVSTLRRKARLAGWTQGGFEVAPTIAPKPHVNDNDPAIINMANVEAREIRWLWQDRIARGRITVLSAPPGCGKSFLTVKLCSHVSNGDPWPDGTLCVKGDALMIACEDDPHDTIRPRLDACGANVSNVHMLEGAHKIEKDENGQIKEATVTPFTLEDVGLLDRALQKLPNCKLVVIDPIGSYFGTADSHVDTEVRGVLAPLADLARKHNVACVLVAHTRKSATGTADDGVLGSRAFTGLARNVHHMFRDPLDPDRRLFVPGKSNIGREPVGVAFRLEQAEGMLTAGVEWLADEVFDTADDLAGQVGRARPVKPRPGADKAQNAAWLHAFLEGRGGWTAAQEVLDAAEAHGITASQTRRLADALMVRRQRTADAWYWVLPEWWEAFQLHG